MRMHLCTCPVTREVTQYKLHCARRGFCADDADDADGYSRDERTKITDRRQCTAGVNRELNSGLPEEARSARISEEEIFLAVRRRRLRTRRIARFVYFWVITRSRLAHAAYTHAHTHKTRTLSTNIVSPSPICTQHRKGQRLSIASGATTHIIAKLATVEDSARIGFKFDGLWLSEHENSLHKPHAVHPATMSNDFDIHNAQ